MYLHKYCESFDKAAKRQAFYTLIKTSQKRPLNMQNFPIITSQHYHKPFQVDFYSLSKQWASLVRNDFNLITAYPSPMFS